MATSIPKELELIIGSTKPFQVKLFDEQDGAEDLSAADKATFSIRDGLDETTDVLLFDTGGVAADLSIDEPNSQLVATPVAGTWTGVEAGEYIGQAAVRFGDADSWQKTDLITVLIRASIAPTVEET